MGLKTKVKGLINNKTHTHTDTLPSEGEKNDPAEQRPLLVILCDRWERRGDSSDNTKRRGCEYSVTQDYIKSEWALCRD